MRNLVVGIFENPPSLFDHRFGQFATGRQFNATLGKVVTMWMQESSQSVPVHVVKKFRIGKGLVFRSSHVRWLQSQKIEIHGHPWKEERFRYDAYRIGANENATSRRAAGPPTHAYRRAVALDDSGLLARSCVFERLSDNVGVTPLVTQCDAHQLRDGCIAINGEIAPTNDAGNTGRRESITAK